ncbi:MAG: type II secretion system protein [Candidatus Pacebacteria bacterium]|nr:type II secretion system protein [Candidatus Paceibacterota bacterium]
MNKKSFTLIELLVVISIIAIMSGILVINSSSSTSDVDLFSSRNGLINNLNKAKEMALSGVGATVNTNYGIGVWFPESTGSYYYIYKNNETTPAYKGYDSGDVIIEKVNLPKGIKYTRVTYLGVLFTPPQPSVAICQSATACTGTSFQVRIHKEGSDGYRLINVNKSGLIE